MLAPEPRANNNDPFAHALVAHHVGNGVGGIDDEIHLP
jgi:hypothetical protein